MPGTPRRGLTPTGRRSSRRWPGATECAPTTAPVTGSVMPCTGRKLSYYRWLGLSCRLPVFVDQSCEPGPALDPGGRDGEGDDVRGVVRRAQAHALALMAAAGVVVADVLGQDHAQVLFASDEHPVSTLSPYRAHEALGIGVR